MRASKSRITSAGRKIDAAAITYTSSVRGFAKKYPTISIDIEHVMNNNILLKILE